MRSKFIFNIVIPLLIIIGLIRCANVGQPTGGPRDLQPPILISTQTPDQSLNFNQDKISFNFDEYVKVEDIKKQLIITPSIEDDRYNIKVKNNVVTLEFKDKLQENTTYSINFGEAIRDITESNKARNIKFGFSTGSYIDSLSISGKITTLLRYQPVQDVVVGLYDANDTLNILNSRPIYFSKTDSAGNYQIENIKNNSYRIYATVDKNNNLRNDPLTEAYGFKGEIIQLDSSISNLNIPIYKMDSRNLKIQSARPDGSYYLIKFNKPVNEYILQPVDNEVILFSSLVEDNKTLRIYNTITKDSIEANLNVKDSLDQELNYSFNLKFIESRKVPEPFNFTITPSENEIKENYKATLIFNKPIKEVLTDSIFFQYDSLNIDYINPEDEISLNENRDRLTIRKKLSADMVTKSSATEVSSRPSPRSLNSGSLNDGTVRLYLGPGSFVSIENDSSKILDKKYKFTNPQEVGTIEGTISTEQDSFIVQLLDKGYKVIDELRNQRNYKFNNVKPGDYRIRILVDNDNDGTWDPGNIHEYKEPEDVFFHDEIISIRANWERTDVNINL
ncbi:Ig-like domain-containing protein [soil metagenome]